MKSDREIALSQYRELIDEAKARKKVLPVFRAMALKDLYFLLIFVLNQKHMLEGPEYKKDWLYDRCREVQAEPDGVLDLWAREHYKSTIKTYGMTIQDILNNPELTIGLFSFNRPTAKAFLIQIKREFEQNRMLFSLFPEILWKNPEREAPKWSENDGIVVKRKGNPKESTVEAWGLVDGQPTSKHFDILVYDDIITRDSVTTRDMIKKVTEAWELSLNLSKEGGRMRTSGTHYHFTDTYMAMIDRGIPTRKYPGTHNGEMTGRPVLFSEEYMAEKRTKMGSYVFSCQILLNPKADSVIGFDEEWLRFWPAQKLDNLNIYILVDPASSKKKKENDFTVIMVIGLGPDENYYWIDGVRDRMNLTDKARTLIHLHRQYKPLRVGYEEYGLQADIEYIEGVMDDINYHFTITPLGGRIAKSDRIEQLIPLYEAGRFYLPHRLIRTNYQQSTEDLVKVFINEEYKVWPYALHDDMLDTMARILDPNFRTEFPELRMPLPQNFDERQNEWDPLRHH